MINERVLKVSEFNELINAHLGLLGEVVVQGEISDIKISQSKWVFGSLKDDTATIDIFGMIYQLGSITQFEPGMLVKIYGTPRLYEKTGKFSIFINQIIPVGEGSLRIAFEKLKDQLTKEGLFEISRKRSIARFPQSIGLITAKNSQAYQDFIKILNERMNGIKIYFYPVLVQGKESPSSIVEGLKYLNQHFPTLDLIVLTRGGGSLEDLIGFNAEIVVRQIFGSKIPVVSAIGHEGDWSLTDLVADLRASTPSNAAELIVPDRKMINEIINSIIQKSKQNLLLRLQFENNRIDIFREKLNLSQQLLFNQITQIINRFNNQQVHLKEKLTQSNNRLTSLIRILSGLDYTAVLKRGFSITMNTEGKILKNIKDCINQDVIVTTLIDGKISSVIQK